MANRLFRLQAASLRDAQTRASSIDQERLLLGLVERAAETRFGRDHGFGSIRSVADFQSAVPIRSYEAIWAEYLRAAYPVFEDLTWPGRIPYLALTSGTTEGPTKYIPVSREMIKSNRRAAQTALSFYLCSRQESQIFRGKVFFLGGATALAEPAPSVREGDLSGIAAVELAQLLRPYTFPPLALALEADWDRKLALLAERSISEPITMITGVPGWLLGLFERVLEKSGKSTIAEVWPWLELIVHGGVKFEPYRKAFQKLLGSSDVLLQEVYPCSEGFIAFGDPACGVLRLLQNNGLFFEFIPVDQLGSRSPSRHWLKTAELGVNYAIVVSTCAGMWAHLIGDTICFESLDPPLIRFTGRTRYSLSAFGEHLISEEVERAMAVAADETGACVRDWHVGPVFAGAMGYHQFVVEFLSGPDSIARFREVLDAELSRHNADYLAHRAPAFGLPLPALLVVRHGGFDAWMRHRGKLGGQNKVPRMDCNGTVTDGLVDFVRTSCRISAELGPGCSTANPSPALVPATGVPH
jgi:hypothetical protein